MNNRYLVALATAGMLSLATPSFAQCGVYVGGQLGWGNTDYGLDQLNETFFVDDTDFVRFDFSQDGVAGRVYLGYQFNCYFGVEVGAAVFSDVGFLFGDIETQQYDLLLKVGMPFGCSGFRGDIKLGIADVVSSFDPHFDFNEDNWDLSSSEVNFALGASVSYNICRCVSVDLSWLHTFGNTPDFNNFDNFNRDEDFSPDTDLVTVGFSYTFM